VGAKQYSLAETERFVPETHSSQRSDFARDRGRVLHSSALRRLAAKTQVLSPTAGLDFARNRLTHSLEVAQIGRELANRLGLDADVVETACLAHDIGHPPFGHNGERALAQWASECGGFEGNAQTLRLLVRLEPKVVDSQGLPRGLNLTRASLVATIKYPWDATASVEDVSGRDKFGVYGDDRDVFDWAREGLTERILSVEAQVMDFSDDVAYSVHDFEDAIVSGYVDPSALADPAHRDSLLEAMANSEGSPEELGEAWERLERVPGWVTSFDHSRVGLAGLKNLTSTLIGRFAEGAQTYLESGIVQLAVPEETRAEIALLKGVVAQHVMFHTARQHMYVQQREMLTNLAQTLYSQPEHLDAVFAGDWARAQTSAEQQRVVCDQVASLTDQSAMAWVDRVCS